MCCLMMLYLIIIGAYYRVQEVSEAVVDLTTEGSSRNEPIDLSENDR